MSIKASGAIVLAALASLMLSVAPAYAGGVVTSGCLGNVFYSAVTNCVQIWSDGIRNPHIISVPAPRTDQEFAEAQTRERRWLAHCKPVVRHDEYGVARYIYAARGCEFGLTQ